MFNLQVYATNGKRYTIPTTGYKQTQLWLKQLSNRAGIITVKAIRQVGDKIHTLTYNGSFSEVSKSQNVKWFTLAIAKFYK